MIRSITTLAIASLAMIGAAQDLKYSVYIAKGETTPVVGYRITPLPRILGTKLNGEAWTFAGLAGGTPIGGVSLVLPFRAAENATGYIGFGVRVRGDKPTSGGLILGYSVRLK